MFIKGVSTDRENNGCNWDYQLINHSETKGLLVYMHQFHVGYRAYYYNKANSEEIKLLTEEEAAKDPSAYYTRQN